MKRTPAGSILELILRLPQVSSGLVWYVGAEVANDECLRLLQAARYVLIKTRGCVPSGTGIGTCWARVFIAIGCKPLGLREFVSVVKWWNGRPTHAGCGKPAIRSIPREHPAESRLGARSLRRIERSCRGGFPWRVQPPPAATASSAAQMAAWARMRPGRR